MDTLKYSGKAKVTIYRNGTKIGGSTTHNEGTLTLFRFFADCLCANYDERNAPTYMRVDSKDPNNLLPSAPLTQKNVQTVESYPTTMLQSTLKFSNARPKEGKGVIDTIQLLNSEKVEMAYITLSTPVELASTEYSAVVQWYLRVDNFGESSEGVWSTLLNNSSFVEFAEKNGYTVTKKGE